MSSANGDQERHAKRSQQTNCAKESDGDKITAQQRLETSSHMDWVTCTGLMSRIVEAESSLLMGMPDLL